MTWNLLFDWSIDWLIDVWHSRPWWHLSLYNKEKKWENPHRRHGPSRLGCRDPSTAAPASQPGSFSLSPRTFWSACHSDVSCDWRWSRWLPGRDTRWSCWGKTPTAHSADSSNAHPAADPANPTEHCTAVAQTFPVSRRPTSQSVPYRWSGNFSFRIQIKNIGIMSWIFENKNFFSKFFLFFKKIFIFF